MSPSLAHFWWPTSLAGVADVAIGALMAMGTVTDATVRLRRRRQDRRRRGLVGLAWIFALVLVLSGVAFLFFGSSVFVAKQVRVEGVRLLSADQVEAAAAVDEVPLARIDRAAITERVSSLPAIQSVKVQRSFPSTVVIEVTERTAAVQRQTPEGQFQWVDPAGVVFHTTSTKVASVVVVSTPTTDARLLRDAGVVAASLSPALKQRVVRIEANSPDTFGLVLSQGQSVVWGSADDSATKSQVATALLKVKATVYDVSSPATPTSR